MKCSVFIATSVDGYIARPNGDIDWLQSAGNPEADMRENPDMGFVDYFSTIDCMIMGRKCMEVISSMDLTEEQWPYGDSHIVVLSNTLKTPPENMKDKVQMYSGYLLDLVQQLESDGYKHAYIDGGTTITSFINQKLINEIIITRTPILLGEGIPLFGHIIQDIKLDKSEAIVFPNDFIQVKYTVNY